MQVVRLHQSDTCCIQDERMKLYNEYLVPLLQLKSVYYKLYYWSRDSIINLLLLFLSSQ